MLRATINLMPKVILFVSGVICLSFGIFILPVFLLGASPVDLMVGYNYRHPVSTEDINQLFLRFGLVENPDAFDWIYMFWRFIVNSCSGDFGISLISRRPVSSELFLRVPNTLLLLTSSTILSTMIGIYHTQHREDASFFLRSLSCSPVFWIGMMLLLGSSFLLTLMSGAIPVFSQSGTITYEVWIDAKTNPSGSLIMLADILYHLVLPCLAITSVATPMFCRVFDDYLSSVNCTKSIQLANAKGITDFELVSRFKIRPILFQLLIESRSNFHILLGSTVLIEVVFNWSGIGNYFFVSLYLLDYPAIIGSFMTLSFLMLLVWLIPEVYEIVRPQNSPI